MGALLQKLLVGAILVASASCAASGDPTTTITTPTVTLGGTLPIFSGSGSGAPGIVSRTLPFVGETSGFRSLSGSVPGIGTIGPGGTSSCVGDLCGSISSSDMPNTVTTPGPSTTSGMSVSVSAPLTTLPVTSSAQTSISGSGSSAVSSNSLTAVSTGTMTSSGVTQSLSETSTTGSSTTGTESSNGGSGTQTASSTSSVSPATAGAGSSVDVRVSGSLLSMIVAVLGCLGLL